MREVLERLCRIHALLLELVRHVGWLGVRALQHGVMVGVLLGALWLALQPFAWLEILPDWLTASAKGDDSGELALVACGVWVVIQYLEWRYLKGFDIERWRQSRGL